MVEIRQADDDLPHDVLLGPGGHTRGLLCRKHAQQFIRLPSGVHTTGLDEPTGDYAPMKTTSDMNGVYRD
jgi:hypothetical protein